MRQKLLPILAALLLLPAGSAFGQWTFAGAFPSDSSMTASVQGIAVLPNTNVVIAPYSGNGLYVYSADGVPLDTVGTLTSAGGDVSITGAGGRGIVTAPDGSVLYGKGGLIYRVDVATGALLGTLDAQNGAAITQPAIDAQGMVYQAHVVSGAGPLRIYNPDFTFVENVVDTTRSFIRAITVTEGGDAVYVGAYEPGKAIWKYTRPDEFSPFGAADTLFRGVRAESMARNPATGHIWFSNGRVSGELTPDTLSSLTWYALDPATDTIVDSIKYDIGDMDPEGFGTAPKPRGMAFSVTGDTAYVGVFDVTEVEYSVQMFVRGGTVNPGVERTEDVPTAFALQGNYPNPFNPSTSIRFSVTDAAHATLRVYDTLGREVAVLVDERLAPGVYNVPFDGHDLASGTYLYVLEAAGQRQSRTMVLLK